MLDGQAYRYNQSEAWAGCGFKLYVQDRAGMLGVTLFGLMFTPIFYVLVRWIGSRRSGAALPSP
jgi:hypothetical protein